MSSPLFVKDITDYLYLLFLCKKSILIFHTPSKILMIERFEEKAFVGWMKETGNIFTGDEYHFRLGIWLSNKRYVQEKNRVNLGFTLALNRFAHLTENEYRSMLGYKYGHKSYPITKNIKNDVPTEIDWREQGIVNKIKNQGACGSCWAFSAIQVIESQVAKNQKQLYDLSEQNLLDCVTSCFGCGGGWSPGALEYVYEKQNSKFMLTTDYPYTAVQGTCKYDNKKAKYFGMLELAGVSRKSETELAKAVATYGPAMISIDASQHSFMLYKEGIYDEPKCSEEDLDHAVGCVGYGVEGEKDYWIVRNSWGEVWGEKGYVRMIRNKNNQCGVATEAYNVFVN